MLHIEEKSVLIAIQARSTSTRFPGKIFELIGSKTVLQHVIDQAKSSQSYVSRPNRKIQIRCSVAVLYPENDSDIAKHCKQSGVYLIPGSEFNVLSRYIKAMEQIKPDYIVRLTADCPLLLDFVISKHINTATINELDYVSNVEEKCRNVADGFDCEVMSKKAIEWLKNNVKDEHDNEHVTTLLRRARPKELRFGFISSKLDTSNLKMSLDTPEDLERIRKYYHEREYKLTTANSIFGKEFVYEI